MYANYHTHTYLCNHAVGTMEEYVQEAIKNDLKILGFSDHCPYPFSVEYDSWMRMSLSETKIYVNEVLRLKEKYKDSIQILLGYEAEYYPKEFDKMLEFIRQFPCDYLILGQHNTHNEYDGCHMYADVPEEEFIQYVSQVIEGMKTGVYSYLAHPDYVGYRENLDLYRKEMTRLCKTAKELQIPLEFNLLGFREKRPYPFEEFWEIVAQEGNDVILGCDAHSAVYVGQKNIEEQAKAYLSSLGITPIEQLKLNKV